MTPISASDPCVLSCFCCPACLAYTFVPKTSAAMTRQQTSTSLGRLEFITLVVQCDKNAGGNRGRRLRGQQNALPLQPAAQCFLWCDDSVSWLKRGAQRFSGPQAVLRAHHGTICPDYKDRSLIGELRRASRLAEIPLGTLSRPKRYGNGIEDLSCYHDVTWPLGHDQNVSSSDFDVRGRVFPAIDLGRNSDGHAAQHRTGAQLLNAGLCL